MTSAFPKAFATQIDQKQQYNKEHGLYQMIITYKIYHIYIYIHIYICIYTFRFSSPNNIILNKKKHRFPLGIPLGNFYGHLSGSGRLGGSESHGLGVLAFFLLRLIYESMINYGIYGIYIYIWDIYGIMSQ